MPAPLLLVEQAKTYWKMMAIRKLAGAGQHRLQCGALPESATKRWVKFSNFDYKDCP